MAALTLRPALAGPQPGHQLLFSRLYEQIRAGVWGPDQQIPSERELCERYGVSRSMVRQALQQAELQGLLVRVPGKGTFVAQPRVRQELRQLETYQATLEERAMKPGRRVLSCTWQSASPELELKLEVPPGSPVLLLDTLALGNDRPMALFQSYLPSPLGQHVEAVIQAPESDDRTTYELAGEAIESSPQLMADQTFEAVQLDVSSAHLLMVPAGSAAFRITTVFRVAHGRPVEYRISLYPGGRYSFHIVREVAAR
ncbi:MAG: GntR family transcriptional regulator [Chloroflexi bacterium]|nr:GntR family transcriptional regulator [Chloroflexota bacterium]